MGLFLAVLPCSPALQFEASVYDDIKPSIVRITCSAVDRSATGFLWSSSNTAVTAMHVIAGCGNIIVHYESAGGISRPANVEKVYRRADLALLKITNAPSARALVAETTLPSLTEQLSTLGYPLQIPSMTSTPLQLRYGGKTLRNIVPPSVADALSGGSPSLDLEIDNIDGHLLPGHSGAPIFDRNRKIVAIADGGLENGAAAISWGIPVKYLDQLAVSSDSTSIAQAGGAAAAASHVLFSAETETRNGGQSTCSGLPLTKLRSASFAQMSKSVDDTLGLAQLVQFFGIDPSGLTFDVYQHLPSGATFVLPSGAHMKQTPDGDCIASFASDVVQIHLQLGVLASPGEAQAKSQSFEQSLAGRSPQGWAPDPQWTNLAPIFRFDGLVVRRRAYAHYQSYPAIFLDKYLFEALAVRNNVFIGSAAYYAYSPALAQHVAVCRFSPGAPNCDDVRLVMNAWIQSVLAIQLTTFPVG